MNDKLVISACIYQFVTNYATIMKHVKVGTKVIALLVKLYLNQKISVFLILNDKLVISACIYQFAANKATVLINSKT